MNELSDRIILLRKAQSLTQMQLAERVGITQAFLAEIEKGRKKPSIEVLEKLCDALGCSADYLLGIAKGKNYRLLKEELPASLKSRGLTVEMLQEVFDRNISKDELTLALKFARVIKDDKENNSQS